jgi:hypothetical protein
VVAQASAGRGAALPCPLLRLNQSR